MFLTFAPLLLLLLLPLSVHSQHPIPVLDCAQLQKINDNLIGDYVMFHDINCTDFHFVPIGYTGNPFRGSLNGNGFAVINLTINRPYDDYVAVFTATASATISEISFFSANVTGNIYPAILIGYANNTSVIDVHVQGQIVGKNNAAGLIGYSIGVGGTIQSCSAIVTVSGGGAGGLIGAIDQGLVTFSASTGSIINSPSSFGYVGGLIGLVVSAHITNCFSTMIITGGNQVGGLVGGINGGIIEQSYSAGNVTGNADSSSDLYGSGGLVGQVANPSNITNSYSLSTVDGGINPAGGLIGTSTGASVMNAYAAGNVVGKTTGGLLGRDPTSNSFFSNSYWDLQTTGQPTTQGNGGSGLSTAAMFKSSSFVGWDFTNIWWIDEGVTYPSFPNYL